MKLLLINFLIFVCTVISIDNCFSQNVDNLRSDRESLLKDIESTNKLLSTKKASKEAAYQQVLVLNKEISIRNKVVDNFKIEIEALEERINVNQSLISDLEIEIKSNKEEYGKLLIASYRRRNGMDELSYFFSSSGFSEAYKRYRLLQEYSRYRKKHVEKLIENQAKLKAYLVEVQAQMEQKEKALLELQNESQRLSTNQVQKKKLVTELQKEEKWLLSTLKEKEKKAKDLDNKIMDIIRLSKKTPASSNVGSDFTKFKGKFIWPVKKGVIVSSFGEHEHPILKSVLVKNNGIDIQTIGSQDVLSVYAGEVSRVISIPGYNNAIIIRHGTYISVYANLISISVKAGQKVNAGHLLGEVFKEKSDAGGILHFEIWNENQKLDPSKWLMQ
jgi:septal ring factor EnvC (AmiA/AmiB activator)